MRFPGGYNPAVSRILPSPHCIIDFGVRLKDFALTVKDSTDADARWLLGIDETVIAAAVTPCALALSPLEVPALLGTCWHFDPSKSLPFIACTNVNGKWVPDVPSADCKPCRYVYDITLKRCDQGTDQFVICQLPVEHEQMPAEEYAKLLGGIIKRLIGFNLKVSGASNDGTACGSVADTCSYGAPGAVHHAATHEVPFFGDLAPVGPRLQLVKYTGMGLDGTYFSFWLDPPGFTWDGGNSRLPGAHTAD